MDTSKNKSTQDTCIIYSLGWISSSNAATCLIRSWSSGIQQGHMIGPVRWEVSSMILVPDSSNIWLTQPACPWWLDSVVRLSNSRSMNRSCTEHVILSLQSLSWTTRLMVSELSGATDTSQGCDTFHPHLAHT